MNAPGANSISVAELAVALMLSLARSIPAADAFMKAGVWEKKKLTGGELRGKTLGIVGLGRIGQEVGARARAFGMSLVAHDPFISEQVAGHTRASSCSRWTSCAASPTTSRCTCRRRRKRVTYSMRRGLAKCKPGVRIVNTARGELIDEGALADAIEARQVAGAGLDVFQKEPPADWRLAKLPQVVATPHIAASTVEAQEQVGIETAVALRDFLQEGVIRNAVNFPRHSRRGIRPGASVHPAGRADGRARRPARRGADASPIGIRYYGPLVSRAMPISSPAPSSPACLRPMLSSSVTVVNARAIAAERGIEVVESRSSRPRSFANILSVKLQTTGGECWIEGTVFEGDSPRLTQLDGVDVEVPLGRRLAPGDPERRPARRDWRGRHDPRPPRHQYRQLCARPRARAARWA